MSKECERSTCDRAAVIGRLCRVHHAHAKARGEVGFTSSAPVLEHLRKLRELGWEYEEIARVTGLSATGLRAIVTRSLTRCRRYTANPILAVPLEPARSTMPRDATGLRRRVQALQTMGWRYEDICAESGVMMSCLAATMSGTRETSFATAAAIADAYEVMCMKQGPSRQTASWAKNRGFPPPMAWDEATIDDPDAAPAGTGKQRPDRAPLDEVLHFKRFGLSPERIAARLGVSRNYVQERLREATA